MSAQLCSLISVHYVFNPPKRFEDSCVAGDKQVLEVISRNIIQRVASASSRHFVVGVLIDVI